MSKPASEFIKKTLAEGGTMSHMYDPQKAHQYYEVHKHLKGRHHGSSQPAKVVPIRGSRGSKSQTKTSKSSAHGLSLAIQARVHQLEARLANLEAHLQKLLASKAKRAQSKHHQTTAQKQKRAASSKQYQQNHKSQIAAKQKARRQALAAKDPLANMTEQQLRQAIQVTIERLHAAVAQARATASRGTA